MAMPSAQERMRETLAAIAAGRPEALEGTLGLQDGRLASTGLSGPAAALVRIAALIALDAPPAAYAWQIAAARDAGVGDEEIVGSLCAVAPQVGSARAVAAAAEIMVALGLMPPDAGPGRS